MSKRRCNPTTKNSEVAQSSSNDETSSNKPSGNKNKAQNTVIHTPPLVNMQLRKRPLIEYSAKKIEIDIPASYTPPLISIQVRKRPVIEPSCSSNRMTCNNSLAVWSDNVHDESLGTDSIHIEYEGLTPVKSIEEMQKSPTSDSKLPLNEACNIPNLHTLSREITINSLAEVQNILESSTTPHSKLTLNKACNIPCPPAFSRANTINSLALNEFDKKNPDLNLNFDGYENCLMSDENDDFEIEGSILTSSVSHFSTNTNGYLPVERDETPNQVAIKFGACTDFGRITKTNLSPQVDSRQVSVQFTDTDVLLGRGGMTNKHPGNQKFRDLVDKVKPMYHGYQTKAKKKDVSQLVVDDIQQSGGRFLKNLRKDINSPDEWVIARPDEARKKASQALREARSKK